MSLKYYILNYIYWKNKVILKSGTQLQSEKEVSTDCLPFKTVIFCLSGGNNILNASFGEESSTNSI